jgi:hypothetical protein
VDLTELVDSSWRRGGPFAAALPLQEVRAAAAAEWERTWDLQRIEDEIDARTELPETIRTT